MTNTLVKPAHSLIIKNAVENFCKGNENYILNCDLGLGKTHTIIEHFKKYQSKKNELFVILTPYVESADEYYKKLKENSAVFYSQSPSTLYKDIYDKMMLKESNPSIAFKLLLKYLAKNNITAYPLNKKRAETVGVIISTHANFTRGALMSYLTKEMTLNKNLKVKFIIDESPKSALESSISFELSDLEILNVKKNPVSEKATFLNECTSLNNFVNVYASYIHDFEDVLGNKTFPSWEALKQWVLENSFKIATEEDYVRQATDYEREFLRMIKLSKIHLDIAASLLYSDKRVVFVGKREDLDKTEDLVKDLQQAINLVYSIASLRNPIAKFDKQQQQYTLSSFITPTIFNHDNVKVMVADGTSDVVLYEEFFKIKFEQKIEIFPDVNPEKFHLVVFEDKQYNKKTGEAYLTERITKTYEEMKKALNSKQTLEDSAISWKCIQDNIGLKANFKSNAGKNHWEKNDFLIIGGLYLENLGGIIDSCCSLLNYDPDFFNKKFKFNWSKTRFEAIYKHEESKFEKELDICNRMFHFVNKSVFTQTVGRIRYHRFLFNKDQSPAYLLLFVSDQRLAMKYLPPSMKILTSKSF